MPGDTKIGISKTLNHVFVVVMNEMKLTRLHCYLKYCLHCLLCGLLPCSV